MTLTIPSSVFLAAMKQRKANHPFERVSAYKVRESWDVLHRNLATVLSIAAYLRARKSDRHPSMLVGCTEEDKAYRLKRVPQIIARELGYNLLPAVAALHLEGVPEADIIAFIQSIKPKVDRILAQCDAIEAATARSIKSEYAALKSGSSPLAGVCTDALDVAEQAVSFCKEHGAL
ncbi:MAG: hypothetical protein NXH71_01255 [Erythrobacteraceae bacterium]|jgi:hypothetical protein|nr:hypothetical protein [Erythrobacteraceae bacterium]